jgi:carbamoyltransferase
MWILGLNSPPVGWHDAAACLVDGDGQVWALAEEERFTRVKHAIDQPPFFATRFCLRQAGISPDDVDVVAVGWDLPRLYPRIGTDWTFHEPKAFIEQHLGWKFAGRHRPELVCVPHHRAHAAAAFYASGFSEAGVLVVDGNGDDEAISIYEARYGRPLVCRESWPYTHSLGYLYDAASRALGLTFLESGKTMGLASYGRAARMEPWKLLNGGGVDFSPLFTLSTQADYDDIMEAWMGVLARFAAVPRSTPSSDLDQDLVAVRLAWSAQATLEEALQALAAHSRRVTGLDYLCLSGGVALNSSANGLLPEPLYVPPVPHDAGVALGAAWAVMPPKAPSGPLTPYLGRPLDALNLEEVPNGVGVFPLDIEDVVGRILNGQVGAVVWGRAEIGPRALGHRSIIALPSNKSVSDRINRAKGRELWRPLAPVGLPQVEGVLWEPNPMLHRYMLGTSRVTEEGQHVLPAAVHIDQTARPQVTGQDTGVLELLLEGLRRAGAAPVLLNTSFNRRGEPIINEVSDALTAYKAIGLDFLIIGDNVVAGSPLSPDFTVTV